MLADNNLNRPKEVQYISVVHSQFTLTSAEEQFTAFEMATQSNMIR